REILLIEERVDSCEVLIDNDCETFISLQSVHPVNIPFVLMVLKINRQLERIGDLAAQIAGELLNVQSPPSEALLEKIQMVELYQMALKMLELVRDSYEKEDISLA